MQSNQINQKMETEGEDKNKQIIFNSKKEFSKS